ncbi:DUF4435 domain-containing protein [Prevotella sp. KH2C16]|uniref:DUF4435 domain-containing protein n=1 Tax=Prevotella sp. KH2C16 TaxID=1855325 RepID=UPI0008E91B8A|nr:DUF4435 domain-containing protein [Prevotella sp. KH2C16]SFG49839.1 Protein of unknown function [Prevotella sp. KH2C16]
MSKRLREGLSSRYFEAANKMTPKDARHRIIAYVESYDDVFFWRTVLDKFETDELYFQIMLPTRSKHLERGKKAVLMEFLEGKVGRDMIACVDADYDYLIQGATPTSRSILSNPYVFHTYAYAIENLQCFAPSLHAVCVAVTLNDHRIFDFEEFLRQYSQAIYPLFVWNIWYYRTPNYGRFTMTDFLRVIETGNFRLHQADEILRRVRHKVGQKIRWLQRENPDARQGYQQVKDNLRRLGVTPDNTYLYIQGHHLFDKVVVPMLESVCSRLIREREVEIDRQSVHATQRRNELSSYSNSLEDVPAMLKKNAGGMASDQFRQIQRDVEAFVKAISTAAAS